MDIQQIHTRSCVSCYQRKLKCNREQPCQRCVGRNVSCIYPENKITRNRPKKGGSPSLREKVARLEKEVIGIKDVQSNAVTVYAVDIDSVRPGEALYVMDESGERKLLSKIGRVKIEDEEDDAVNRHYIHTAAADVDERNPTVPFMLPMFSSMAGGPSGKPIWTPTAEDFENFFTLFCERVDPIVRIVHKPSVRRLIDRIKLLGVSERLGDPKLASGSPWPSLNPEKWTIYMPEKWSNGCANPMLDIPNSLGDGVCSPIEFALLMSVAAAATSSLMESDPRPQEMFGENLAELRRKVFLTTEVSMSRIKLSSTTDFTALQAFTLHITTKVLDDNSPEIWHTLWSPVALAVRIATAIGIHKDGSNIGLPPFPTEMRRRLWWHLALLSIRTSEDYTCGLFSLDDTSVKFPANLDDDDLDPDMVHWPSERREATEMTASLLRFEAMAAVSLATRHDPALTGKHRDKATFAQQIQRFEQVLETKYLAPARAQPENERSRLILALGKVAVLKMCWVWGFSLMRQNGQTPQLTPGASNLSDELFITVTKMLEQQVFLHTETSLKNLYWILRNIKPWDGLAILLAQMMVRLQKLYPGVSLDQLPQMLKDAWNVASMALKTRDHWVVDQKLVDGLEKMWRQIGEMMGLPMRDATEAVSTTATAAPAIDMQSDDFSGPMALAGEYMQVDGMDLDTFMAQSNAGNVSDPWPMFIPMNFNFFGNGPF